MKNATYQFLIYLFLSIYLFPINADETKIRFSDQTQAANIHFTHINGASQHRYLPETMGAGCLFFDYDNDGYLDIFLVNSGKSCANSSKPRTQTDEMNVLYRNNGDGTFTDVTAQSGFEKNLGYGMGCVSSDYDNDGDADLYLTNYGSNQLYRNNGDGTFTDVTTQAGVGDRRWSVSASFGDYNLDGYLDLYVANYLEYEIETAHPCILEGVHIYCGPHDYPGAQDTLYRNNGDGTFTDVTEKSGVGPNGKGMGVLFTDYNNDGHPDIFVANDAVEDFLYHNNGDGTFTDVAVSAGIAYNSEGRATASMGIANGDYDNDGLIDLFITNFSLEVNSLFHNDGDSFYTMTTFESGLAEPSFSQLGFGTHFLDADNNGTLDLFVANGHVWDNVAKITPSLSYKQKCQFFTNTGEGIFRDISEKVGVFFTQPVVARGTAIGDYDNDGDIDILISCSNDRPILLRNDTQIRDNWLKIELIGTKSNRDGIGSKVIVHTGDLAQVKEVTCGGSYASNSELSLLFGLGTYSDVLSIEVKWTSGDMQRLENISVNQVIRIEENR